MKVKKAGLTGTLSYHEGRVVPEGQEAKPKPVQDVDHSYQDKQQLSSDLQAFV